MNLGCVVGGSIAGAPFALDYCVIVGRDILSIHGKCDLTGL